jgi:hypothetical protein
MPSKRIIPVGGKHFRDLRSTDAPAHELQRSDAFGGESSPPSGSRAKGDGLDAPLSQLRVGGRNSEFTLPQLRPIREVGHNTRNFSAYASEGRKVLGVSENVITGHQSPTLSNRLKTNGADSNAVKHGTGFGADFGTNRWRKASRPHEGIPLVNSSQDVL